MKGRPLSAVLLSMLLLIMGIALLGCPKRPEVAQAGPAAVGPGTAVLAPTQPPEPASPPAVETPVGRSSLPAETPVQPAPPPPAVPEASPLKDVFFDFDTMIIREDQKAALNEDVAWLKANGQVRLTLEGHCDERGTAEYNIGLGERRAKAVKEYLVGAGIPADRIATISYGKERPFVLGHDESAWKWNRRGHFVISGP
jgi:peptidoglycan-associated lipoprotein